MPILYSVIARGKIVLARFATCSGNFGEVADQILPKIDSADASKLTYGLGEYMCHYIVEDKVTYLCITDTDFERSKAFMFLNEIKKRFKISYGSNVYTALPFAMNAEFSRILSSQMRFFSDPKESDKIVKVKEDVDELRNIMVQNIESLTTRGERLELLINKADNLNASSVTFSSTSRHLARSMFWKNIKIWAFSSLLLLVIIYFIVSMACGGLSWQNCLA
ncbi:vesicle-associated membrane protein 7-like [Artemia franciscana]|uniref:Vesicle-associated membrane protein 7 n=1 Tax=Artemia franciscana TaxID=6661 RepID=A0AA88H8W9_ARTSF|nr:hypothetical protein QYM36_015312 [Artemia franciscana]